jgi:hypothetical protein
VGAQRPSADQAREVVSRSWLRSDDLHAGPYRAGIDSDAHPEFEGHGRSSFALRASITRCHRSKSSPSRADHRERIVAIIVQIRSVRPESLTPLRHHTPRLLGDPKSFSAQGG